MTCVLELEMEHFPLYNRNIDGRRWDAYMSSHAPLTYTFI